MFAWVGVEPVEASIQQEVYHGTEDDDTLSFAASMPAFSTECRCLSLAGSESPAYRIPVYDVQ